MNRIQSYDLEQVAIILHPVYLIALQKTTPWYNSSHPRFCLEGATPTAKVIFPLWDKRWDGHLKDPPCFFCAFYFDPRALFLSSLLASLQEREVSRENNLQDLVAWCHFVTV